MWMSWIRWVYNSHNTTHVGENINNIDILVLFSMVYHTAGQKVEKLELPDKTIIYKCIMISAERTDISTNWYKLNNIHVV